MWGRDGAQKGGAHRNSVADMKKVTKMNEATMKQCANFFHPQRTTTNAAKLIRIMGTTRTSEST